MASATMRANSPETSALLTRVQDYVPTHAARLDGRPSDDVGALRLRRPEHPGGRRPRDRRRGLGSPALAGDRTFDLPSLPFYDGYYADIATTRVRVWQRELELVDAETFGIYLHHMIHRQADWSIRHHAADPTSIPRTPGLQRCPRRPDEKA